MAVQKVFGSFQNGSFSFKILIKDGPKGKQGLRKRKRKGSILPNLRIWGLPLREIR